MLSITIPAIGPHSTGKLSVVAQASPPAGCSGVPPPVPETRTGTVPEPAAGDGCATRTGGGTAERLHQPRGADGQRLQNQRCQRPLAALILKWLGNGHGTRFIPGLTLCKYCYALICYCLCEVEISSSIFLGANAMGSSFGEFMG